MKIVLSIFYGFALAIVTFIKTTDVITRLMAKRYARRLHKTKVYLTDRPAIDRLVDRNWRAVQRNADWMNGRMAGPPDLYGKHARAVTNDEIDRLIDDCDALIKLLKRAIRKEHRIFKKLSDYDRAVWPAASHDNWHSICRRAEKIVLEFQALRQNVTRNDGR